MLARMLERWSWLVSFFGGWASGIHEGILRSRDRSAGYKGSRLRRLLPPVFLSIVVLLVASKWSWIDAQARAVVVLSSILETPTLTSGVEGATGKPRFANTS